MNRAEDDKTMNEDDDWRSEMIGDDRRSEMIGDDRRSRKRWLEVEKEMIGSWARSDTILKKENEIEISSLNIKCVHVEVFTLIH